MNLLYGCPFLAQTLNIMNTKDTNIIIKLAHIAIDKLIVSYTNMTHYLNFDIEFITALVSIRKKQKRQIKTIQLRMRLEKDELELLLQKIPDWTWTYDMTEGQVRGDNIAQVWISEVHSAHHK